MTRTAFSLGSIVAIALLCLLHDAPAHAQTRVFVAAQGSDSNPCTFALPCRTFQHAHDTVAAGGEIDVLDPAGYGKLVITKAISIQGHGFAGISVPSVNGITINAAATDAVSLNGLLIDGIGAGSLGILFGSGGSLVVENCVVRNMTSIGLVFLSNVATLQMLSVSNSYFADNGKAIVIQTLSSGAIRAAVERSAFYGNGTGLQVTGTSGTGALDVAVTDSVSSNGTAGSIGFFVQSTTAHSVSRLVLTRVMASGNVVGVAAQGANATLRLTQSTVTANATGYSASSSGVIFSYGDNTIDDNGSNTGTLTSAAKQ